ncbi:MAG: hypothetical protein ACR2NN_25180 [Bryobacteraceae bacterium]
MPPSFPTLGQTTITVQHQNGSGNTLYVDTHTYVGVPSTVPRPEAIPYSSWKEAKELGTTLGGLKSVANTFQQGAHVSWWSSPSICSGAACADFEPVGDPHLVQADVTLLDTGQISRQTFGYDQYSNQTDVNDYDYGPGSPSAVLLRQIHTDYVTNPNYTSGNVYLPSLPALERMSVGATTYGQTQYEYDVYQGSGACANSSATPILNAAQHGPVCTQTGIVQMDPAFVSGGVVQRGNVTRVQQYLNTGPADVFTYRQYDVAGNVVRKIDTNGNQTEIDYDSNGNSYAFASRITDAVNHSTRISWDVSLGKPLTVTDPNNQRTGASYADALDRLKQTNSPDGGFTIYDYNDTANTVTTTTGLTSSGDSCGGPSNVQSDVVYDGLGRKMKTDLLTDPSGTVTTTTSYDALGRVFQVSNPYRSGDPHYFTTTTYDALSRVQTVQQPDGTPMSYGYTGNQTSMSERACNISTLNNCGYNTTTRITDALGRLTSVLEANNSQTLYQYDPLGNLLNVNQSGQSRQFRYDSLNRLLSANSPENGFTTYGYDANGNLLTVVQGGVTRNMAYDALNRIRTRSYTDYQGTGIAPTVTAPVTYSYDQPGQNAAGHLTQVTNGVSTANFLSFDAMGRVTSSSQSPGALSPGAFVYAYNLAGGLETETYPSGRSVITCYEPIASHWSRGNPRRAQRQ